MTILFVFKIILLNERFARGQPSILLASGCWLASGKEFSARLQTVNFKEAKVYIVLAFEDLPRSLKC